MARKSEIRAKAAAGLDALLKAASASDDAQGAAHLQEALEHITEAAGVLPEGKSLREVAADAPTSESLLARLQPPPSPVELRERDFTTAERTGLAKRGHAIPVKNDRGEIVNGHYPIVSRDDVENAVDDADRTGASRKVRKHIIRQAQRLGVSDLIPASWKAGKARESTSAPLTLRERAAIGEGSLIDVATSDAREDRRLPLLQRLGIDADEV